MNFFDHKDLGNHLLQLCPKVVKHPVYVCMKTLKALDTVDRGKSNAAEGCHGVKKLMINYVFKNEAKVREKVTSGV